MLRKFIAFALLLVIVVSCQEDDAADYGPINQKIIEDYIAEKGITGAQSTASGLYYVIEKPGGEVHPTKASYVSVNYQGFLTNGTLFDTSYKLGKPYSQFLTSLVVGWQEGVPLIGVGGKIKLLIPSELGYGSGATGIIPANSVLIFDIELVDFY